MKCFAYLSLIATFLIPIYGLRCWSCYNAKGLGDCKRKGRYNLCDKNQLSCMSSVRNINGFWQVSKYCKQARSCISNYIQNQRNSSIKSQCNHYKKNSVCRCCCNSDSCNFDSLFCADPKKCLKVPQPLHGSTKCEFTESPTEIGSVCSFTCFEGYKLVGSKTATCIARIDKPTAFDKPLPQCKALWCSLINKRPQNRQINCSNQNFVGSVCKFSCKPGFLLVGSETAVCANTGSWKLMPNNVLLPICRRVLCHRQWKPLDGSISCSNKFMKVGTVCRFFCNSGFELQGSPANICFDDKDGDLIGQWTFPEPLCQIKICKPASLAPPNGIVICSDYNVYGSKCKYKCNGGYKLNGNLERTCNITSDGKFSWNNPEPTCTKIKCPQIENRLKNGFMICSNSNNLKSICQLNCNSGFLLEGDEYVTCLLNNGDGRWSDTVSFCREIRCLPPLQPPTNGSMSCSSKTERVVCGFSCDHGFELMGSTSSKCNEDSDRRWSHEVPYCKQTGCSELIPLENGNMNCTDGSSFRSICNFSCDASRDYFLSPDVISTQCLKNPEDSFKWEPLAPKCIRNCPPSLFADVVILLDSSSSITPINWKFQLTLAKMLIRKFKVGRDFAKFSVVSVGIDDVSEITFQGVGDDKGLLLKLIDNISYFDKGASLGSALNYIQENSFTAENGGRNGAQNIVYIITFGEKDETEYYKAMKEQLKNKNILIFDVGMQSQVGSFSDIQGSFGMNLCPSNR